MAVLLIMIIKSNYWGRITSIPTFKRIHAYTFGSPPTASRNLAEEYSGFVSGYVFESDIVPRISYGAILDFRELIICAHGVLNTKTCVEDKMILIDKRRLQLLETNRHIKAVHTGQIYIIFKKSRMCPPRERCRDSGNDIGNEYVVEKSSPCNFLSMHIRMNQLIHHSPKNYKKGLERASRRLNEVF